MKIIYGGINMNKKLIIGISAGVLVIIGIVLAVVFIPKNNAPVVKEEEVQENKEIQEAQKVSMTDEEKYDFILKANAEKSIDECLIEKIDVDFDGGDEFVYYPEKTLQYADTMKIYGGEEFKEVVDLSKCMGLYKIELLEHKNSKEKVCILYELILDGFCYRYDKVSKLVKNGESFTIQELFLNQCDTEQETIVNANVIDDEYRKCVSEYLVNGKKVSEDEYNKEKKSFEEKYKVVKKFEVVSELDEI